MRLLPISLLMGAFIFFSLPAHRSEQASSGHHPAVKSGYKLTDKTVDFQEKFELCDPESGTDSFFGKEEEDLDDPRQYAQNMKKRQSGKFDHQVKTTDQNISRPDCTFLVSPFVPPLLI